MNIGPEAAVRLDAETMSPKTDAVLPVVAVS